MFWRTLAVVVALLGPGCSVPNPNHCGNLEGGATCKTRDPARPYCSLCVGANDGCVAEPVVDPMCGGGGGTGTTAAAPTTDATTSVASTSTGAATTTGAGTTDAGTTGASTTGTASSTGTTGTTDASTGPGTTGTTDMTSGTASTGGSTEPGPMCGDGELQGMEACDTDQFGGKTCLDFGAEFGGGMLKCTGNCTIDTAGCCKIKGKPCVKGADCCSGKCLITCQ